jgi:hypothetical protein
MFHVQQILGEINILKKYQVCKRFFLANHGAGCSYFYKVEYIKQLVTSFGVLTATHRFEIEFCSG